MSPGKIAALVSSLVLTVVFAFSSASLFENVDANEIVCIQAPVSGKLTWYTSPGTKWQGFGKVTTYKKRDQFWFSEDHKEDGPGPLKIKFNDGGNGKIHGGLSWEMPLAEESLNPIHTKYGSQEAVEKQLIGTIVDKSIYMTGPHMSSTESYASRRSELLQLIEDQVENGIISTRSRQNLEKDPITGEERTITVVEIVTDENGKSKRVMESPLKEFGVKTYNLTINHVEYEETVESQIKKQQQSVIQVQTAIADAKRAEQQALTAKKEGEAAAAKAEWEQKAIAAKQEEEAKMRKNIAQTEAEQKLAVAKLAKEEAEQKKQAEIALGEGESKRRQMVMEADGALEKKLEALVEINKAYAQALGQHQGPLVPTVQMSGNGNGGAGITQMLELLTAKAAMDLGVNLKPQLPVKK